MKEHDFSPTPFDPPGEPEVASFDQRREANLRSSGLLPNWEWSRFADRKFRAPHQFGEEATAVPETVVFER